MPNKIFNNQILNKQVQFCTEFFGNNIAKFVDIQIIVKTLILKFEITGKHNSIDILFMVTKSAIFACQIEYDLRTQCKILTKMIFHNPETYTNGYCIPFMYVHCVLPEMMAYQNVTTEHETYFWHTYPGQTSNYI